jgi:hypothetical protein
MIEYSAETSYALISPREALHMGSEVEKHLYVHDGLYLSVSESFPIFEQFKIEDYLHGRCHLLASVLSEVTGLKCGVLLDLQALIDENDEPVMALEHAFCVMVQAEDLFFVDARGVRSPAEIKAEYDQAWEAEVITGKEASELIAQWIDCGKLDDFLPGERQALIDHVQTMAAYPWLTLLPDDSCWHSHETEHSNMSCFPN